jgi:hypothetical protein
MNGTDAMPRKIFTDAHQAAARLGVPVGWLKAEAKSGRIPSLVTGRHLLFDVDLVADSLRQRSTFTQNVANGH